MVLVNQFPRTLGDATESVGGLLSPSDKTKLNNTYVMSVEDTEPTSTEDLQVWIGNAE